MELNVNEDYEIEISNCFNGVGFIADNNLKIGVCSRDNGFEINVIFPNGDKQLIEIKDVISVHISN